MRKTVVPGVWLWSVWQPDRGLDFNGFFVESGEGNLVVDPIAPDDAVLAALVERGVALVVITNRDHERAATAVATATGARIAASAHEAALLSRPPDLTVARGERVHGWEVIGLDGFKTAGEIALYDRARRTAIVGDAIWGTPAGALTLMPDVKLADPARAALSARALRMRSIDNLLVGDGTCVFGNAQAVLGAMLDARTDAWVNRVNVEELDLVDDPADPPPYTGLWADAGRLLGAERLGYAVARLRTGEVLCPLHWHTREEELCVVVSGAPTLRTPRGTVALRAGDLVAFRAEPGGAHQLRNDAQQDALVLLVANTDAGDVCCYPDSEKHVVEATGTLVRSVPQLDYFDGEVPERVRAYETP